MATLLDIVKKDSTNRSVTIRIVDDSAGTPETGVVFNTAGIDLWYRREGATKTSITEADLATPALDDPHLDGGFLHIGDGEYRLDLPDAAFATGANYVDVGGTVTGMVVIGGRVRLVDFAIETAEVSKTVVVWEAPRTVDAVAATVRVAVRVMDEALDPVDLDSLPGGLSLSITQADGTAASASVGTVVKDTGTGRYYIPITTTTTAEDLIGEITATRTASGTQTLPFAMRIGEPMRGTDSAYTGTPPTVAQIRQEMDANSTQLATIAADTTTLLARITSTLFSGITSLAEWLGLMAGKQTGDATARTEIRATGAGSGTYDETTDSLEANKDAGTGDATAANQTTIINLLSNGVITSNTSVDPTTNAITIIEDATYDGTAHDLLSWDTSNIKDFTGWSGTFTVEHAITGVTIISQAVTIASSTEITVALDSADTAFDFSDDQEYGAHRYDITLTSGSSVYKIGPYIANLIRDAD